MTLPAKSLIVLAAVAATSLVVVAQQTAPAAPAGGRAGAQAAGQRPPQAPLPEGYWPRGKRPAPDAAPGMRITDLGKGGRTYKLNFTKGDELLSGMTAFAETYKIKNGHFAGLGAIDKGILGWTDTERGNGQKMIPVNEESEIISFLGGITTNAQGVATVHAHGAVALQNGSVVGGHIFEMHISIIGEVYVTEEEEPAPVAAAAR